MKAYRSAHWIVLGDAILLVAVNRHNEANRGHAPKCLRENFPSAFQRVTHPHYYG